MSDESTQDTSADETPVVVRDENMIGALKRERAGMVAQGKDDRVAQIDEQLKLYGHNPAPATEASATEPPKGAKTPPAGKTTTR